MEKKEFSFANIGKYLKKLSQEGVYTLLLLFFTYQHGDSPTWAKRAVLGALAYLVAPIDAIPDLSPFIGFTDDLSVLAFALVNIACHINDDIKASARKYMGRFFKDDLTLDFDKFEQKYYL